MNVIHSILCNKSGNSLCSKKTASDAILSTEEFYTVLHRFAKLTLYVGFNRVLCVICSSAYYTYFKFFRKPGLYRKKIIAWDLFVNSKDRCILFLTSPDNQDFLLSLYNDLSSIWQFHYSLIDILSLLPSSLWFPFILAHYMFLLFSPKLLYPILGSLNANSFKNLTTKLLLLLLFLSAFPFRGRHSESVTSI